jgi:hypothetical protein
MYTSSKYSILLLLSLTPMTYSNTAAETQTAANNDYDIPLHRSPAEHFKDVLNMGLIKICHTHRIDPLKTQIYSPEEETTFTSETAHNSDRLPDLLARTVGVEPTVTVTTTTTFSKEELELYTFNRFKRAILKFAEIKDLCESAADKDGKTITCTAVLTLEEFKKLQAKAHAKNK